MKVAEGGKGGKGGKGKGQVVIEDHTDQTPNKLLSPSSSSSHQIASSRTPKQTKIYGPLICQIELSRLSRIPPPPRSSSSLSSSTRGRNKLSNAYDYAMLDNSQQCYNNNSEGMPKNDKRRQSESPLCKPLSDSREYLSSSSEREKKRPSSSLDSKSKRNYSASPSKPFSSKSKQKTPIIKPEYEENDVVNGLLPPPMMTVVAKEETSELIPKEYLKLNPMDTNVLKVEPSHNLNLQSNGALDSATSNDVLSKSLKRRRLSSCNSPYEKERKKNKKKLEVRQQIRLFSIFC